MGYGQETASDGHATCYPQTCYGHTTDFTRADYGLLTSFPRTCNGLVTDFTRASDGPRAFAGRLSSGRVCVRRLFVQCSVASCVAFVLCWFVWRSCAADSPRASDGLLTGGGRAGIRLMPTFATFQDGRRRGGGLATDGKRTRHGLHTDGQQAAHGLAYGLLTDGRRAGFGQTWTNPDVPR